MKLKNPTPTSTLTPVIFETAAFLLAAFFPTARGPVLVLQGLKILSVWASGAQHSGNRSSPSSTASS
ncbi:MAG: hypothetical protein ACLPVO_10550 [Desulfomonilaceae bacterium]|nr:hypothetical protein [Syntrophaceae bacterium]